MKGEQPLGWSAMCTAARGRSTCRPGRPTAAGWRSSAIATCGGCPSGLFFGPRAPLPQSDHRTAVHGMAEQPSLQQDLAAVMAVVREVVDEEARGVVGEPHDAPTRRDCRRYHAQDRLALGTEGPHRLCGSDAES